MADSDDEERAFSLAARKLLYRNEPKSKSVVGKLPAGEVGRHVRTKVTMNIDGDILQYFKSQAKARGRSYQLLMNDALRAAMDGSQVTKIAEEVRDALREDPAFIESLRKEMNRK